MVVDRGLIFRRHLELVSRSSCLFFICSLFAGLNQDKSQLESTFFCRFERSSRPTCAPNASHARKKKKLNKKKTGRTSLVNAHSSSSSQRARPPDWPPFLISRLLQTPPKQSSRPFDIDRDVVFLCSSLVLQAKEGARKRHWAAVVACSLAKIKNKKNKTKWTWISPRRLRGGSLFRRHSPVSVEEEETQELLLLLEEEHSRERAPCLVPRSDRRRWRRRRRRQHSRRRLDKRR